MEENVNVVNASAVSDEEIARNYEKTVNSSIQEATTWTRWPGPTATQAANCTKWPS